MLRHPPPSDYCRLCVKSCKDDQHSLYDETGQANANHDLVSKYFTNAMLNMEWEGRLQYVCGKCWQQILKFHQFQESAIEAQKVAIKEFGEVDKAKSEMNIKEEQQEWHKAQEFVRTEDLMNSAEEQMDWHNAKEFIASTEDSTKATPLTFVIKSEEPLDLNNDYEGMSLQDGHDQLADEEMSHMASSKENASLRQDDDHIDDYSSNNEIPSSSLEHINLCSSDKNVTATKKTVEEFDELVALWRTSLKCEICHQLVASYSQLEEHFRKQHASEVCYLMCCQLKLEYRYNIEQHINYHNAPQQLRCEACCKSYRFVQYLRNHIRKVHTNKGKDKSAKDSETLEGNYRCDKCPKTFATKRNLSKHSSVHKPKSIECNICGKYFSRQRAMLAHMAGHIGEKTHTCSFCPKAFTRRPYLSQHMNASHPQEWKKMQDEAAQSATLKGYRRETRGASVVYVCLHCFKECDKQSAMYYHLRRCRNDNKPVELKEGFRLETRGESKVYVCIHCSRVCDKPTSLHHRYKRCLKGVSIERPLLPFEDNQTTLDSLKLAEIMSMYTCPLCCRLYETKRLLHSHIRRMHQKRPAIINLQTLNSNRQEVEVEDKDNVLNEAANKFLLFNYLIEPTAKGAYRCKVCFKEYENTNSLCNHIASAHSKIAKLEQESMETAENQDDEEEDMANIQLKDHVIRMDSFKRSLTVIYKCKLCPKIYEKKRTMFAHLREIHKQSFQRDSIITRFQVEGQGTDVAPRTKFRCDLCSKEYENQGSIFSHVRTIHKRSTQKLNEATDPTYTKILARLKVPSVEIATPMPPKALYKCPFCPMQYKTNGYLYAHTRSNHKNKFANYNQKKLQYRNLCERSPNGGFRCKICSKLYEKKCSLYGHISRLHPAKFKNGRQVVEENLATSSNTITSVLYRCKFCTKAYDKIYLLNTHLRRTHKKSSKKESLFLKYEVRSDNPPRTQYKCKLCFKEYDNRYSIYRHVTQIHNQDTLYTKIVVTKTTDATNAGPDNHTLNKEEEAEDSLMTAIEGKELKIEEFSPESYTLGNEKMVVNEMPSKFEDATWEEEEFIKSENEFIDL
uniref:Uncharacterized protein n=1 Tax=Stomoxys calcitrans TaxID=35570 RepID=A0A1I8NT30_STOCA